MTERTERDEHIDKAIQQIIADDTEGWILVATKENDDVRQVGDTEETRDRLIAVYMLIHTLIEDLREIGIDTTPKTVVEAAKVEAQDRGLLPSESRLEEIRESHDVTDSEVERAVEELTAEHPGWTKGEVQGKIYHLLQMRVPLDEAVRAIRRGEVGTRHTG